MGRPSRCCLAAFALLVLLAAVPLEALAGHASVFTYHRFGDDRYPSTNISTEVFAQQLQWLKQNDYAVLTLGDIVARLRAGTGLPERCAALTVDDGYRTFLTGAMPLLKHYGYPATVFVSTDSIGRRGYLSWDELRELAAQGIEVGNHAASHPYLVDMEKGERAEDWRSRIRGDIDRARQVLEQELGTPTPLFAYPYGEYSPEVVEIVKDLGFTAATAQQSGVVGEQADLYTLPRFPMGGGYATLEGFRDKLAMKPLPVTMQTPVSPLLEGENPPLLVVQIDSEEVDAGRLQCFVPGNNPCQISRDPEQPDRFRIRAQNPLSGRRSKYTLTAPGKRGGGWYWFSQLWILGDGDTAGGQAAGGE